jgi:hypothetical protein
VFDTHRTVGFPAGDAHRVGESDGSNLGFAEKLRPDASTLISGELDRLGIRHPVDVTLDRLNYVPHVFDAGFDVA